MIKIRDLEYLDAIDIHRYFRKEFDFRWNKISSMHSHIELYRLNIITAFCLNVSIIFRF